MKEIDLEKWNRISHYNTFKNIEKPQFSICSKIEVTNLVCAKENFFNKFLFNIMQVCNAIQEFRLRIIGDKVYEFDFLDININLLCENNCFESKRVSYSSLFEEFDKKLSSLKKNVSKLGELNIDKTQENNLVVTSYIPWIHFDSISEPIFSKEESLIKIVYGRYSKIDGKFFIPVCVTAHHGLVDGYHIGRFFEILSKRCQVLNCNLIA